MRSSEEKEYRRPSRDGMLESGASGALHNDVDYEKILEKIGFGKTQWILLIMSGLLTVNAMATQTSVGIMAIASQCDFEMTQTQKGLMMAASVAGIFLSTYFWGYVSDAFGRRTVMLNGTILTVVLQFVSMFVTNIWIFNFINLIIGVGLGGVAAAIYAYLSEFNTAQYRAVVINYSTMFVAIAAIYVPATCWLVLSAEWSWTVFDGFVFRPWRLIILLNLLPGLIGALMLYPFPESPKLLLAQNKESEAVAAVEWICHFNTGRSVVAVMNDGIGSYKLMPEVIGEDDELLAHRRGCGVLLDMLKATTPLFYKPHRVNFCISAAVVFGLFSISVGMQIWYPEIVNRSSGGSSDTASTVCEKIDDSFARQALNANSTQAMACDDSISTKTYVDNIIVGVAFLIGFIVQGALLNPIGRKNVMLGGLTMAVLSGILLHFITDTTGVVVLFCLYILLSGLSISVMCGAVVDLVPTHLRGKAVSICFTLGRLGVIVSTNLISIMLEPLCNTTFAIFTASMLICLILVRFLPI